MKDKEFKVVDLEGQNRRYFKDFLHPGLVYWP